MLRDWRPPRQPASPARPGRLGFALQLGQRAVAGYFDDRGPQLAASIAYHVLFSIFPLAIFLAGIFGIVVQLSSVQGEFVDAVVRNVPLSPDGDASLRRLLEGATGRYSALGLLGLLGLLWAAAGMMAAIRVALNSAWDVDEPRPLLKGKLIDIASIFAVAVGALASIVATVAVRSVSAAGARATGVDLGSGWAGWMLGILFPLVTAFVTVFLLYRLVPAARVDVHPTASVAAGVAVAFVVFENLFALYVQNFANYNAVYGSLGAVIAFMVFVYLTASLFLLGAEVASEWPRLLQALADGEVEAGPPLKVQVRQFAKGLWVRERTRESAEERRRSRSERTFRSGRGVVGGEGRRQREKRSA